MISLLQRCFGKKNVSKKNNVNLDDLEQTHLPEYFLPFPHVFN